MLFEAMATHTDFTGANLSNALMGSIQLGLSKLDKADLTSAEVPMVSKIKSSSVRGARVKT